VKQGVDFLTQKKRRVPTLGGQREGEAPNILELRAGSKWLGPMDLTRGVEELERDELLHNKTAHTGKKLSAVINKAANGEYLKRKLEGSDARPSSGHRPKFSRE